MNHNDRDIQPTELSKPGPDFVEYTDGDADKQASEPLNDVVVSAYAGLSTSETVRKFWRLYLIGFAVAFSGT